ncbi:MAG: proline racemase family protein [Desulfosarcina sp.]|nr:proline racemase family protein [Desulfosarcina sp.]MBC2744263.1 proline racemase family protein [Desulfosarcina sp.]MBC2767172.1 proline racemase [Desulfosarcina sp.]
MNLTKIITTVDTHTAGEPTRVVTGGIPHIPGKTMGEKKSWIQNNLDHLRKMLMWEPRGHQDMFGAIITSPASKDAHAGVIFMDSRGYLDMCGHGSIGAVTVLINTGMIPMPHQHKAYLHDVVLDTPAGKISARALIENNTAKEVTFQNVPAFFYESVEIQIPSVGNLSAAISYGGNFFALVDAQAIKTKLELKNIEKLKSLGLEIRDAVNDAVCIIHPLTGEKKSVDLVEIYQEGNPVKNMVVFGNGQVDRSPCGTGTCAKMAYLYSKGILPIGQPYIHASIIGTTFVGRIVGETVVGEKKGIIPEITGQAHITGIHHFVSDEQDPFKNGFSLNL